MQPEQKTTPEAAIQAAWFARHPGAVGIAGPALSASYTLGLSAEAASNLPGFQADALRKWSEILADAAKRMEAATEHRDAGALSPIEAALLREAALYISGAMDSLREHMAMVRKLRAALAEYERAMKDAGR